MNGPLAPDIIQVRKALRQSAIAARDALQSAERMELSERIVSLLSGHLNQAALIHCYINFRSEVETRGFIENALGRGVRVVVPIVEELNDRQVLVHSEIQDLSKLKLGTFGIHEPIERNSSELKSLDAVIVPLVAFDRRGTRLGYGKGFYDAFLKDLPKDIPRIGLAFAVQEVGHIPALPHDEPLDIVITEKEIIRCG